jgi:hypothetical protein
MNDLNNGTDDIIHKLLKKKGSETMSKTNSQLAIRQEKFIRDLKNAFPCRKQNIRRL